MAVNPDGRTVSIRPKARILKSLSRIEFDPWQCIAELVDNAFDEFIEIKRSGVAWNEPYEVAVSLPASTGQDATLLVADNGRGMTLERVRDAVSAGYSGNDPQSKLGLFGLGFNVASARIGAVTRFLTTQAGDADWIGVEIDLDTLTDDFDAPVVRRPKDSPSQHGTIVEISRLEPFAAWFTRPGNATRLRQTLGGIYSYLLDSQGFRLKVNDIAVKPVRHCTWSPERSVTRDGEAIPAVIEIDEDLGVLAVCHDCGRWQDPGNAECENCGSSALVARERRIWGWIGIQRYLDQKEFGLDFLRNGRKIMRFDRSIFQWRDPEDPAGRGEPEYPLEVPYNAGRIVGEIHLDHVAVNYTKDSFDTGDRAWRYAVEKIRGLGPLLPQRAATLNYPRNDSPLGRLHRGYRRNDPGANYLTPGNGKVRVDNRDWDKRFRDGDPDYQDDTRWWELVVEHDRLVAEAKERGRAAQIAAANATNADVTAEFRAAEPPTEPGPAPEAAEPRPAPETQAARVERLTAGGQPIPELHGDFAASAVPGRPVRLAAYRVRQRLEGPDGKRLPAQLVPGKGGSYAAFVDLDHPHFATFADDPADIVLMELAQNMLVRAPGATISAVFAELKDRYLRSRAIDEGRLIGEATQLLRDLAERMVTCVVANPARPWLNALTEPERHMTEDRITEVYRTADIASVVDAGQYLPLVPPQVVPRIVEEWPEAFFDDRLFTAPYRDVASPTARRQTVAVITAYLLDIAWLASGPSNSTQEQLVRATLSLRLVPENLAG